MSSQGHQVIGFAGLGAMGGGMAKSLVEQDFKLQVYDPYGPSLEALTVMGATGKSSPADVVKGVTIVCIVAATSVQVSDFFFGEGDAAEALEKGTTVVIFSTVEPDYIRGFEKKLQGLKKGINVVDSPLSGGAARARAGTLTIMASGSPAALSTSDTVLKALTRRPAGRLYLLGETGMGSNFKMCHQVMAAVHIATASEAMSFGANLGLNPRALLEAIKGTSASSFMLENRGERILHEPEGLPASAISIILKDVGIITTTARITPFAAPLASMAEQLYLAAKGMGLVSRDDSQMTLLWEAFGGRGTKTLDPPGTELQPGDEEKVRLVKDLLYYIHLAAASEALAFAAKLGMDLEKLHEIVVDAAGASGAFAEEVPRMLKGDTTVVTPLKEVCKRLSVVCVQAKASGTPVFMGSMALQAFLLAEASGLGDEDAISVLKVQEKAMGIKCSPLRR